MAHGFRGLGAYSAGCKAETSRQKGMVEQRCLVHGGLKQSRGTERKGSGTRYDTQGQASVTHPGAPRSANIGSANLLCGPPMPIKLTQSHLPIYQPSVPRLPKRKETRPYVSSSLPSLLRYHFHCEWLENTGKKKEYEYNGLLQPSMVFFFCLFYLNHVLVKVATLRAISVCLFSSHITHLL